MKVEHVDFYYLSMPQVLDIGNGSQDALLVRIQAGDHVGWGECEASPLTSIASAIAPMSHSACKPILASVLGEVLNSVDDISRIGEKVRANSFDLLQMDHTLSGIDMALWDLMGKKLNQPAWKLVGYERAYRKRPYASMLFGDHPDETLAKVKGARDKGFLAVKLGWGTFGKTTPEVDAAHIRAAREGLGEDGILLIDAGTIFTTDVEKAAQRLQALSDAKAHWLEEPFHNFALEEYAELASRLPEVALAGGEGSHNYFQARQMMRQAKVKFIQVDAGRIGGISAAKAVADEAVELGVTYVNHTFTSSLALAASLVPYAGLKDHLLCEYPVELTQLGQDIAGNPFPLDDEGMIGLSDRSGLGVDIQINTLKKYLIPVEIKVAGEIIYQTPELK